MRTGISLWGVVSAWIAACLAGSAEAQAASQAPRTEPVPRQPTSFGPGTVLLAGEAAMGARRDYPSPVFQDMNGDGRLDIVIGDLWGKITVELRLPGDGPPRFGADEPLLTPDGEPLDFKNW